MSRACTKMTVTIVICTAAHSRSEAAPVDKQQQALCQRNLLIFLSLTMT